MTDRELLEPAAEAAGLHIKAYRVDVDDVFTHLVVGTKFTSQRINWNPLTDDGDALRLAVKLHIDFKCYRDEVRSLAVDEAGQRVIGSFYEPAQPDPYAATRRVIVRAAAGIAKSKRQPQQTSA